MGRRSSTGGEPIKARRRQTVAPNAPKALRRRSPSVADRETEVARLSRELSEALEQQTATSEVLQVISSSPGDLEPVFEAMLEKAVRICDAKFGGVYRYDGDTWRLVATHNLPPAYAKLRRYAPFRPGPNSFFGQLATKTVLHLADLAAEPSYTKQQRPEIVAAVELGGVRTIIVVPMLKDNE